VFNTKPFDDEEVRRLQAEREAREAAGNPYGRIVMGEGAEITMIKDTENPDVYEIDVTKKYILVFPERLSSHEAARMKDAIDGWMKSDKPFLIVDRNVRLVKVEAADKPAEART
jgi:hypothetical protein